MWKVSFSRILMNMSRPDLHDEIAVVSTICRDLGLGEVTPTILKTAHHTTLLISPLTIVARVQSSEPIDAARQRAIREVAVARHLAARSAPVVAPLVDQAGPHIVASSVVTLWPYVKHERTADEADAALAATTLASVHEALLDFRGKLPPYTQAMDRCWAVLADNGASAALSRHDRDLLKTQYRRLRHEVEETTRDWVPLHGDAHLGNLLLGERGPLWTDFEDACRGPREYDIAGLPLAAWSHFSDADQALVRRYADLKSVCVAVWCWANVSRSTEILEAAEYHLHRVREFTF
ncbi:aminoglycoside phosphotransferase family protein [Chelativorans sp. M5D2P16]|uniref:aminoglycoside phosphotransferase family protein n=1 Tax=Chelativorans sp. M5D2P16 TaxID=3095678 RepID=UPI002ACA63F7|nr:aminoglycoside phosphotransferase family protein [Chelativorans sp. M5D2P16]MDZ5698690.1 aminoglycoside phosphotransferase family protein [Chelativorans sp. M5D2P16]